MAEDLGVESNTEWPRPAFKFKVTIGEDAQGGNSDEVSGLDGETQVIEHRHGTVRTTFGIIKMPGLRTVGNVTLKRGAVSKDSTFWKWYDQIKLNLNQRQVVTIELLNDAGGTAMKWTLGNAWPTKMAGVDLKSDGNEVTIHSIELAYETLKVEAS